MNMISGGWKIDVKVNKTLDGMTGEQMALFETAFRNLLGAHYTPLLYVGSQVVAGINHIYIAQCRLVTPPPQQVSVVKVVLYVTPDNKITISEISAI